MKIIERGKPKRGDVYRHFKGKSYVIISGEAKNCTNDGRIADERTDWRSADFGR